MNQAALAKCSIHFGINFRHHMENLARVCTYTPTYSDPTGNHAQNNNLDKLPLRSPLKPVRLLKRVEAFTEYRYKCYSKTPENILKTTIEIH